MADTLDKKPLPNSTKPSVSIIDCNGTTGKPFQVLCKNANNDLQWMDMPHGYTGKAGRAGAGVAAGGKQGQVLAKRSDTDHDTVWVNPAKQ